MTAPLSLTRIQPTCTLVNTRLEGLLHFNTLENLLEILTLVTLINVDPQSEILLYQTELFYIPLSFTELVYDFAFHNTVDV